MRKTSIIPAPIFYMLASASSIGIQYTIPISLPNSQWSEIAAVVFILSSVLIMPPVLYYYNLNKTTFNVMRVPSTLITKGPFRFSRNPTYVSITLLYIGMGFALSNPWFFIVLTPLIYIVDRYVIRAEEEQLERVFGEEFFRYKMSVRRWV